MSTTKVPGLYQKSDGVVILTDDNFYKEKTPIVKIARGFKGAGVLKAYATWCPHCVDKVEDFKKLAKVFKTEKLGLQVYTIEASINTTFAQQANITGFPTILYVDNEGVISSLETKDGQSVSNVGQVIMALCDGKQKCLKTKF